MKMQNYSMPVSHRSQLDEATRRTDWRIPLGRHGITSLLLTLTSAIWGCAHPPVHEPLKHELVKPTCERIITANVVALEQVYYYNRFGSFNPAGIMYALRRDVVKTSEGKEERPDIVNGDLDDDSDEVEASIPLEPSSSDRALAGHVKLRSDKRPRPLVLRTNEGDCLQVTFTNLLAPTVGGQEVINDPELRLTRPKEVLEKGSEVKGVIDSDEPATRHASMHVNGLSLVDSIDSQGANVGRNGWKGQPGKCSSNLADFGKDLCALAAPGETRIYRWYAKKEGTYFFYSMGAPAGGEGDGGQLGLGLFGAINVQPKGAKWYRSQVTDRELKAATKKDDNDKTKPARTRYDQPMINYEATFEHGLHEGDPILNMLTCRESQGQGQERCEIIHSDLNAVIDIQEEKDCEQQGEGNACGKPYREFTVIFHDEITAVQAFRELDNENSGLSSLRDGMGINYGASGLGPMIVANRQKIGPARDCAECKLEEFFLTSWVNGDPAMVVGYERDDKGQLIKKAKYPDDPSNVHHSYLGDPVRFRNMHAGPKETHVFHLHAHQWVEDKHDSSSHYLNSQTISPGATFSYEVHYGGSGNRNFGPGDSIFHCHLYPHFAQGMWELWRTHDVIEDGSKNRWLPDHEIEEGTPTPAVVPLPRTPLPPMPSKKFAGYPFYIKAEKGHRPPQPPLDLDGREDKGTLRRHVITDGTSLDGIKADEPSHIVKDAQNGAASIPSRETKGGKPLLDEDGKHLSDYTARRVYRENKNQEFFGLARQLTKASIKELNEVGEDFEKAAMRFHAGELFLAGHGAAVKPGGPGWTHTAYNWDAPGYPTCLIDPERGINCDTPGQRVLFRVSGPGKRDDSNDRNKKEGDDHHNNNKPKETGANSDVGKPGAPFANPCPTHFVDENGRVRPVMTREYRAVYIQMDMTVNKAGWHDPQARFPVLEEDVQATLDGSRPSEPLFFRANSGECVVFKATNLIPSNLNLDDFQVYSPTDVMGQHIHLVKFDVTSSDGSGNGWNYEDGTLAADEVRERIVAHNRHIIDMSRSGETPKLLEPKTHRLFLKEGAMSDDKRGICPKAPMVRHPGEPNKDWMERWEQWGQKAARDNPWCGAQTTVQRWWADPVLNGKPGGKGVKDRTLRTVFTHDHFGPSSHQHHGFYAALVVEPRNSKWYFLDGRQMGGIDEDEKPVRVKDPKSGEEHQDGGPTSYAANIIVRDEGKACLNMKTVECSQQLDHKDSINRRRTGREFNLAFADFAIVYTSDMKEDEPEGNRLRPVNPPSHDEGGVLNPVIPSRIPLPEAISSKDPGTQLINYRNEPIPLRIGEWSKPKELIDKVPSPWSCLPAKGDTSKKSCFVQKDGFVGDMAHVFSSRIHRFQGKKGSPIFTEPFVGELIGRQPGDPATPLLQAYDGDRVQIRLIQGAQEEQHVFTMQGARWLSQPDSRDSGFVNAQHIGISEHFEFNDRMLGLSALPPGELGPGVKTKPCKAESSEGKSEPCRTDLLFASSAIDNLWDGQWGLMRVYPAEENLSHVLARLPGNTDKNPFASVVRDAEFDERVESDVDEPQAMTTAAPKEVEDPVEAFCTDPARKDFLQTFSIEAWMAKDLLGEKGLVYNKAFGITDPEAILFVEHDRVPDVRSGEKKPEPLILRARAGDCIEVTLTNMLPKKMPDDFTEPTWQKTWSYNMLPPIIEGFNFNQLRSSNRVGLHAGLVDQNIRRLGGAHIGLNEDSTVEPEDEADRKSAQYKKSKTYRWYAGDLTVRKGKMIRTPIEFGVIPLTDQADVIKHPAHGAIGALVIEPQCSETEVTSQGQEAMATVTWWEPEPETDRYGHPTKALRCPEKPKKGFRKSISKGIDTTLTPSSWFKSSKERFDGLQRFKEFVLLYQDALALRQFGQPLPNLRNGDDAEDSGQKAFNYRIEPLWARLGASAADEPDVMGEYNWSNVLSSRVAHAGCLSPPCEPETPIFTAMPGEFVRFRVAHPGGHPRMHSLAIFGHDWVLNPWTNNSRTIIGYNPGSPTRFGATNGIGPARHLNIVTRAGGDCAVPGDYLYRTQEGFMFGGGLWGIFRVDPVIGKLDLRQDPQTYLILRILSYEKSECL